MPNASVASTTAAPFAAPSGVPTRIGSVPSGSSSVASVSAMRGRYTGPTPGSGDDARGTKALDLGGLEPQRVEDLVGVLAEVGCPRDVAALLVEEDRRDRHLQATVGVVVVAEEPVRVRLRVVEDL